jgi:ATP-dependent DNA ligase
LPSSVRELGKHKMITPMVARLKPIPFDREGWLFELRWDGFRAIAEIDEALAQFKRPAILDGEIVSLDEHGSRGQKFPDLGVQPQA